MEKIQSLKMYKNTRCQNYNVAFQIHTNYLASQGWPDITLGAYYWKGLAWRIQESISHMINRPITYSELAPLALQVDLTYWARQREVDTLNGQTAQRSTPTSTTNSTTPTSSSKDRTPSGSRSGSHSALHAPKKTGVDGHLLTEERDRHIKGAARKSAMRATFVLSVDDPLIAEDSSLGLDKN
ncbi:hypothetical protein BOTBODRAFT_181008 [Botryobasidium botryosum FD-172 SS1]|uniref:Uncharacterized protein n=1 Tax=Botryobasidium botryosum (strain FD-172 SS1) TaxID=930990 RepID=A0A067M5F9_BOTB1|nr:hypothetical protein BOTBODRAFT_181008 [Botryobasidium botryosum FD-172 SS1]